MLFRSFLGGKYVQIIWFDNMIVNIIFLACEATPDDGGNQLGERSEPKSGKRKEDFGASEQRRVSTPPFTPRPLLTRSARP